MLNNLTGLRFYAAFWVFLYHFFPVYTSLPKVGYFEIGYLGVDLFFILSGFILTYVYYDKFFVNKVSVIDYWNFVVKRFAKIYPLHFIITLIFIPLLYGAKYIFNQTTVNIYSDTIIHNFLMIHAWNMSENYSWNFPSWSISAEWFAYLFLFAPLSFIYKFNKRFFVLLNITILFTFIYYWISIPNFTMDRYTMNGFPRIIPEFILGVLVGLIKIRHTLSKSKATVVCLTSLSFLIITFYLEFYFQQLCIIGFAGIILSLSYKTYFDIFFASKKIIYLGNISFAFYLTQFLSLIIYEQLFNILFSGLKGNYYMILVQFVMAFGINYFFAAVAYKYFEEPLRIFLVKKMKISKEYKRQSIAP